MKSIIQPKYAWKDMSRASWQMSKGMIGNSVNCAVNQQLKNAPNAVIKLMDY